MNFAAKIPRAFISTVVMKPLAHMTLRTLVPHHLPLSLYHVTVGQLITCSLLITDMGQIPISNGHYKCHSSLSSLTNTFHPPHWTRAAVNLTL